jgi:hypothetical protein
MEVFMSKPIISVWMSKPLPAVTVLPAAEQDRLLGQVNQALADVGGRRIVSCRSEWSSERWLYFGAEEYPDAQALMKFKRMLSDMGWYNYLDSQILLGEAEQAVESVTEDSGRVFKLWMASPTLAYYQMDLKSEAATAIMAQQQTHFAQVGGKPIIFANSFSSERYQFFGLESFPSLDAVREYSKCLDELKWHQYLEGDILLGTLWALS